MSQISTPQLDKPTIIEQLIDGMETSVRSKAFTNFCKNSPLLKYSEVFVDESAALENLANETLNLFNDISHKIGGIPVRMLYGEAHQTARIMAVNDWIEGSWIFTCQSTEDSSSFQTSYTDIKQLRLDYQATTLTE